jgi:hypothetical protein
MGAYLDLRLEALKLRGGGRERTTTAQPKTKERTTVYLPLELKQEMARAAEKAGQTKSIWVERLIASHIKVKAADQSGCSSE